MARYEVTYRAAGPREDGSRVEACVTLPVTVSRPPEGQSYAEAAIAAANGDWQPLLEILEVVAAGASLDVSVAVRLL